MNANQPVKDFISTALECSVYICPHDPGLDYAEILEAAQRAGFLKGEISDNISTIADSRPGSKKWMPGRAITVRWLTNFPNPNPEYRNYDASDFVCRQLKQLAKEAGINRAHLDRGVLVERAVSTGLSRVDTEAAVTIMLITELLIEKDGLIRIRPGFENNPLPGDVRRQSLQMAGNQPPRSDERERTYAIVKDIIERRSDARPLHAEPLDAFASALDGLGHGDFRMWWQQMVGELRRADAQFSPVSICVLSAALVEGALTFVVTHAQALQLGTLGSTTFKGDPRGWKIDDLVKSAAAGGDTAILKSAARARAEGLILTRQRIHAGRMLSEHPRGVPDLRPDEARDAKATVDLVVRAVLDWLQRYPKAPAAVV